MIEKAKVTENVIVLRGRDADVIDWMSIIVVCHTCRQIHVRRE